jgi:Phage gp6-like head-tail connector protein
MATFVTLDQVKARLRIATTVEDADVQDLADQAEAHVIGWCSKTPRCRDIVATWTDKTTVPKEVVAAILMQTGELYRFRGDDLDGPKRQEGEELSVVVRELLRAYHDPVIA